MPKVKKKSYILLKVEFIDDCAKTRGVVLSRQECSTGGAKYTQRTTVFFSQLKVSCKRNHSPDDCVSMKL